MSWSGTNLIINELTAFKDINGQISQNDYLAKVDSDILFISDKIFKKVLKSKDMMIGQKYVFPKKFFNLLLFFLGIIQAKLA